MDIIDCRQFRQAYRYASSTRRDSTHGLARGAYQQEGDDITIESLEASELSNPLDLLIHEEEALTAERQYASFKDLSEDLNHIIRSKL
jgi:hypothetical protein